MSARAERLTGEELERGIDIFARRSELDAGQAWRKEDVLAPSPFRLYRAAVSTHWVLGHGDERVPVKLA
jgi:hypothetical protein